MPRLMYRDPVSGNWVPILGQPVPAGGAANNILAKNSASDGDVGWTGDPSVTTLTASGNVSSIGQNTFGQIDGRRNNAGAAVNALQTAGTFRGLGWDGVSAYRVLGSFTFGADQTVSPTQSGGNLQFATTPNGSVSSVTRLRIGNDGTVHIPSGVILGDASILTNPNVGAILDINGGVFAQRRVAYTMANGANNNMALPTSSFIEFTGPTAAFSLTGFAGGVDGAIINFIYLGTQAFAINHQSTSVAANQTYTLSGVQENVVGPFAGTLVYNANISKWILVDWQVSPQSGTVVQQQDRIAMTGLGSTNTTTYVVISVIAQVNFVKQYAGTLLVVEMGASAFVTGTVGSVYIGFSPTNSVGNMNQVSQFFFNALSTHQSFTGLQRISGLAAGSYPCTWWARVGNAATTLNSDANDLIWTRIREIWP